MYIVIYRSVSSAAVIPALSLGLSLSSAHMSPDQLDAFIGRMLVSRISRRVLAEHQIALTNDFANGRSRNPSSHVGIIQTELSPNASIRHCVDVLNRNPCSVLYGFHKNGVVKCPRVIVDGHVDTTFAYIREQFE